MVHIKNKVVTWCLKVCVAITLGVHARASVNPRIPLYVEESGTSIARSQERKDWTFLVYMAADNDLRGFAVRNINQMAAVGSNDNINIVIHLDIRITGNKKITRRYYIEKDTIIHLNADDNASQKMDSGSPDTLISFCSWATQRFPANNYMLDLWNHGTGIIDPGAGKIINPSNFFRINSLTNKWELDRTLGFLDSITLQQERGICWDDSTGNFLNNQTFEYALKQICSSCLNGGKFAIIGFDACLMSMLEIADYVKEYADIMIGSQEVEMGTGWKYDKVLAPFNHRSLTPHEFGAHIVDAYEKTYSKITDDFTLSAIDLHHVGALEKNVNDVAQLLLDALKIQFGSNVKNLIKSCRSKLLCTHFDEPSYIDLGHFYSNLKSSLKYATFSDDQAGAALVAKLQLLLHQGLEMLSKSVIANCVGANLNQAKGVSIYFPDHKIHSSYKKTTFAQANAWSELLRTCLA